MASEHQCSACVAGKPCPRLGTIKHGVRWVCEECNKLIEVAKAEVARQTDAKAEGSNDV